MGADQHRGAWVAVLEVLGGAAALVGWVALIGGVRVWSRLDALGLPQATSTVADLPREALIAEGVRLLLVPLVVAVLGVVLILAVRPIDFPPSDWVVFVVAVGAVCILIPVRWWVALLAGVSGLTAGICVVLLWLRAARGERAERERELEWDRQIEQDWAGDQLERAPGDPDWARVDRERRRTMHEQARAERDRVRATGASFQRRIARLAMLTLVCVVLAIGGIAPLVNDHYVSDSVRLDAVTVTRTSGAPVSGFYVARSGSQVAVAQNVARPGTKAGLPPSGWRVVVVPASEVADVAIGASTTLPKVPDKGREPVPPTTTTVTTSSPTPGGSTLSQSVTIVVPPPVSPPPRPPPVDDAGPTIPPLTSDEVHITRDGRLLIGLGPFTEAVTGDISLAARLSAGAPLTRLATKPFQAGAHRTAAVRIRLSKLGRRALSESGRLKVRVTVTAIGAQGHAHSESRSLTIAA